ncbi:MAG: hypothetical protein IT340_09310 [Chloroflexi bacterium]|nr:hypothetical protein [Chloroflexota bacterium]
MRTPPDLRPSEDVVYAARRHWSVPTGRAVLPLLIEVACLAGAAGTAPLRAGWPSPWSTTLLATLGALALGALMWLAWIYLDWAGDVLHITTQRVIGLRQVALLRETRRDLALTRIGHVAADCRGALATWLGTGTLTIETAAAPPLVVSGLPAPELARRCLLDLLALLPPVPLAASDAKARPAAAVAIIAGRHWWRLLTALLLPVLVLGAAVMAGVGLTRLPVIDATLAWLLLAGIAALALAGLAGVAATIVGWRARCYGLSDDELLELVRLPWRAPRAVTLTTLAGVQDLAYRVPHPLAHLLDYGEVTLTTTDSATPVTLASVAHPRLVHRAIGDHLQRAGDA